MRRCGALLAGMHTENGQRLDTEYEIPSKSTPHAGISSGSLTRVDIYLDPDRQRITIDVPSSQETVTVHINDEKLPPLPATPISEAGPHAHRLDVPDGGGWAQVDAARRHLKVCDTEANDRGIGVDYTVDDKLGVTYHRGDANGFDPGCGEQSLEGGLHFQSFRVCETDSPSGRNPECSHWEVLAAS